MGIGEPVRHPAGFLDRDGVINRAVIRDGIPRPPASLADLEILPSVPEALSALRAHGYSLVVVSNQPDVARGTCSREVVDSINQRLKQQLQLDAILTCFHDNADRCECRKPKPGLLLQAAHQFDIDLPLSFMVGDRQCDLEAGKRAGCRTFFVDCGYPDEPRGASDFRVASLMQATEIILVHSSLP